MGTNDEQTGNDDETETIGQSEETKTVQYHDTMYAISLKADSSSESDFETEDIKYTSLTEGTSLSMIHELESNEDYAGKIEKKDLMEIDDNEKIDYSKQTEDDEAEINYLRPLIHSNLSDDSCPMETDTSVVSAEITDNKNKNVFGELQFNQTSFEAESESPGESNTSERSEIQTSNNEQSEQNSVQSSPSDIEPLLHVTTPDDSQIDDELSKLDAAKPTEIQSLSLRIHSPCLPETEFSVISDVSLVPAEKTFSPQVESVIMRKSPSTPARNRSVRSDFLTNLVDPSVENTAKSLKLDCSANNIGRPPLPKTSPPKFTGIAKALSPQPYNKPPSFDMQNKMGKNKHSRHSTERTIFQVENSQRDSPSPKLVKVSRPASVEPTPSLMIMETKPIESVNYNLNKSCGAEMFPTGRIVSNMENHNESGNLAQSSRLELSTETEPCSSMITDTAELETMTQSLRNQSLSPILLDQIEIESEQECHSLPLEEYDQDLSLIPSDDGRRSTQGIPYVERNVKFSNPDMRSFRKKKDRRSDSPIRKNRCKSSTLSLHTVAASPEDEDEPPLQRRNSIHNVPFVDVNDPETRTRMERYKEERRSMLRAKYKAEDYLSSSSTRKKKLSTTSSQDSNETKSESPPVSPEILDSKSPPVYRKLPVTEPVEIMPADPDMMVSQVERSPNLVTAGTPIKIVESINTSRKLVDLRPAEHTFSTRKSLPDSFDKIQDSINDKHALQKKWSVGSYKPEIISTNSLRQRPAELSFTKSNPFQNRCSDPNEINNKSVFKANPVEVVTENKANATGQIEENVNVKERASIFGPRKFSESKMRTVTAMSSESMKQPKFPGNNNPTSPSKIKNMAAMFEQKH